MKFIYDTYESNIEDIGKNKMILKKHISFKNNILPARALLKRLYVLGYSIAQTPLYFSATQQLDPDFKPLPAPDKPIYVCGSGASSMQAQFLVSLLQN